LAEQLGAQFETGRMRAVRDPALHGTGPILQRDLLGLIKRALAAKTLNKTPHVFSAQAAMCWENLKAEKINSVAGWEHDAFSFVQGEPQSLQECRNFCTPRVQLLFVIRKQ
jgi:hypothetical protein